MGRTPVTASILSLQASTSATISSLDSWDIWAWVLEWFITSCPASWSALTDSGYLSTHSPTTKNVALTLYFPRISMSCWVSSFPQGDVRQRRYAGRAGKPPQYRPVPYTRPDWMHRMSQSSLSWAQEGQRYGIEGQAGSTKNHMAYLPAL